MEQNIQNPQESAIARSRVFVLLDGTFVARWTENRIQELETGQYRQFDKRQFGAPITDYELNQLKIAGLVDAYDKETVWLRALPDRALINPWEGNRQRSYYLNTTLTGSYAQDVEQVLQELNLADQFQVRVRDDFVVLWGRQGISFQKFDDVERARQMLVTKSPDAFQNAVVAFIETTRRDQV